VDEKNPSMLVQTGSPRLRERTFQRGSVGVFFLKEHSRGQIVGGGGTMKGEENGESTERLLAEDWREWVS